MCDGVCDAWYSFGMVSEAHSYLFLPINLEPDSDDRPPSPSCGAMILVVRWKVDREVLSVSYVSLSAADWTTRLNLRDRRRIGVARALLGKSRASLVESPSPAEL